MFLAKLKTMMLLVVAIAVVGVGGLLFSTKATEPAIPRTEAEKKGNEKKETEKKVVGEKALDKNVKENLMAQADDEARRRTDEERKNLLEEREERRRLEREQDKKKRELVQLHELFGVSDVDVFIDGDVQKPFIKGLKFESVFELGGRKFLQFGRNGANGKMDRLLIDSARITGMRISD